MGVSCEDYNQCQLTQPDLTPHTVRRNLSNSLSLTHTCLQLHTLDLSFSLSLAITVTPSRAHTHTHTVTASQNYKWLRLRPQQKTITRNFNNKPVLKGPTQSYVWVRVKIMKLNHFFSVLCFIDHLYLFHPTHWGSENVTRHKWKLRITVKTNKHQ